MEAVIVRKTARSSKDFEVILQHIYHAAPPSIANIATVRFGGCSEQY